MYAKIARTDFAVGSFNAEFNPLSGYEGQISNLSRKRCQNVHNSLKSVAFMVKICHFVSDIHISVQVVFKFIVILGTGQLDMILEYMILEFGDFLAHILEPGIKI